METTIGIDLGTTFCAVASVDENGRPVILKNGEEETLTPSVIYFGAEETIVGAEAKEIQGLGEDNIAAFFKRNMGDPDFILAFNGKTYSAQEFSTILLQKIKRDAEESLGKPVHKAVITVPAYFSNTQREATIKAGENAGLEVLRIINEPTAAAIAFGLKQSTQQTVLVYDLGGGTFDVTLMKITDVAIEVLATDGDHELGGKNWDDRIANYIAQQFEEEFGINPIEDAVSNNELMIRAEKAKKQLSTRTVTRIALTHEGEQGRYDLDVDTFESLTQDLLERTQALTEKLLETVGLNWSAVDGVLLVGGSTRMPMVGNWVQEMSGKAPLQGINVDEAVAMGAAIQADIDANKDQQHSLLRLGGAKEIKDVMSHSLGIVVENKDRSRYINSIIIPKNTTIPSQKKRSFQIATRPGNHNELEAYMLQGESDRPLDCQVLGKYVFYDIEHEAQKSAEIEVAYAYDSNGVIEVKAVQLSTAKALPLRIEPVPDDLTWLDEVPKDEAMIPAHLSVIIAVDLSGSMSGKPLQKAKEAAEKFVAQLDLSNASIGLMLFADQVKMSQGLCQDDQKLNQGIAAWNIGTVGIGNSAQPFTKAHKLLTSQEDPRFLIVLTDGIWAYQDKAIAKAKKCHAAGIEIIAIGFGTADKKFLRQVATSDENALMTNLNNLVASFSKIAQVLTENSGLSMSTNKKKKSNLRFFR